MIQGGFSNDYLRNSHIGNLPFTWCLSRQCSRIALGVQANVGGVAIAMILLILSKELLAKRGHLPQVTQFGVLYWSGMYIPIVVAMSAGQNVVAAMSGGMLGLIVSVASLIGTVLVIRWLNKSSGDYESYEWAVEPTEKAA
jgi:malonate transporter MadL subunit